MRVGLTPKINADTSNPVTIALRSHMKGLFLEKFAKHVTPAENDIVVYGSTLMRELDYRNIRVPDERGTPNLDGIKSSDIDIGLKHSGYVSPERFTELLHTRIVPRVRGAIVDSGLNYRSVPDDHNQARSCTSEQIKTVADDTLTGDFFLERTYSREEAESLLKERDDYEQLKPYIEDNMNVTLVMGVNRGPFPSLMEPSEISADSNGGDTYFIANALDTLAGKITRSMTGHAKSTDLIDVYRLTHATYPDGKPLIDLDPASPDNELETLRTLIIAYMPISKGLTPHGRHLLHPFTNTDDKKERFMTEVKDQIMAHKMDDLELSLDDILDTAHKVVTDAMSPMSDKPVGQLNLTHNELAFFDGVQGIGPTPEEEGVGLLGKWFTKKQPAERGEVTPDVYVEYLKMDHPEVFERHPELEKNIRENPLLKARAHEKIHGMAKDPNDMFLDF